MQNRFSHKCENAFCDGFRVFKGNNAELRIVNNDGIGTNGEVHEDIVQKVKDGKLEPVYDLDLVDFPKFPFYRPHFALNEVFFLGSLGNNSTTDDWFPRQCSSQTVD